MDIAGMILTDENRSTRRKTQTIVALPTSEDRNSCEFCIEIDLPYIEHTACLLCKRTDKFMQLSLTSTVYCAN